MWLMGKWGDLLGCLFKGFEKMIEGYNFCIFDRCFFICLFLLLFFWLFLYWCLLCVCGWLCGKFVMWCVIVMLCWCSLLSLLCWICIVRLLIILLFEFVWWCLKYWFRWFFWLCWCCWVDWIGLIRYGWVCLVLVMCMV